MFEKKNKLEQELDTDKNLADIGLWLLLVFSLTPVSKWVSARAKSIGTGNVI